MLSLVDLSDRSILVTGASSGIGRATSIILSQLGARLILVGRSVERLEETLTQMEGQGHRVEPFDLTVTQGIQEWLVALARQEGAMRGLVHCAGIRLTRPLRAFSTNRFEELMHVNLTAAIQLTQAFRRRGVFQPPASVVYVSSVMGLVGQPGAAEYCASKGALHSLSRALAVELAPEGIRINCVAPGQVRTEMVEQMEQMLTEEQIGKIKSLHPLGLGEATDVAGAIAFLLADSGRWITGTTLTVDGGYTAH